MIKHLRKEINNNKDVRNLTRARDVGNNKIPLK